VNATFGVRSLQTWTARKTDNDIFVLVPAVIKNFKMSRIVC